MNLGEARSRVSGAIGLSNKAGHPEQLLIDGWYNEAVVQFLRKTKCYVKSFSMALTAAKGDYDLDQAIIAFKSLYLTPANGTIAPDLEVVSSSEIMHRRRFPTAGWTPTVYALEGSNLLMLHPNAVSSGDMLGGLYVPRPTVMTAPAHDPSAALYGGVPIEFHDSLEVYTKWKAADWDDDTSSKEGLAYRDEWIAGVRDAKMDLRRKAGVKWAPARLKRGRRYVAPSPGIDRGR